MRALIVGANGQDGRLLAESLERQGHRVLGLARGGIDIEDAGAVRRVVSRFAPDEVYHLAAYHHSSQDRQPKESVLLEKSWGPHVRALGHFLEAIRGRKTRLFYAASSHVFGAPERSPQSEATPLAPENVYAMTKATGMMLCRFYRERRGVYAACGILYNHESPLRGPEFVSRKIARGAIDAHRGRRKTLVLGDLSARVDWGWAPDYVEAMRAILALPKPGDFVIATGETHTVGEFAAEAFGFLGLDWRRHVREDRRIIKKERVLRVGDASKLRRLTGWRPTTPFRVWVRAMVEAEA